MRYQEDAQLKPAVTENLAGQRPIIDNERDIGRCGLQAYEAIIKSRAWAKRKIC